jgi:hypothetical protein
MLAQMRFLPLTAVFAATIGSLGACAAAPVPPVTAAPAPSCVEASPPSPPAASVPAASANGATVPPAPSSPPALPGPTPPPPLAPAFQQALDAAKKALDDGEPAAADRSLDAAAALTGDDAHLAYLVARLRATRFACAGDFDHAAAALVAVMPALAKRPDVADEFWSHNAMMMIREAQGDPAAALAENDQATLCAERGTWDPQRRGTLAFEKDRWHRAYLTRMLAESRAGSAREALVQYARAALDEYRARGGFADSVAVLEAYFAALDGKRDEALAAARRVDPAKDDDVEDLYLVVVGLEAGGDHAGAEAVRRVMRQPGSAHLARAIMLRWLDLDAKTPRGAGFTPRHASAR